MHCCDTCACIGHPVECLAAIDPVRHRQLGEWCRLDESTDRNRTLRRHVLALARLRAGLPDVPPEPRPGALSPALPAAAPPALAGDLVAALAERIGADRAAKWIAAKLGRDCGCAERRARLNRLDATVRRWLAGQARSG